MNRNNIWIHVGLAVVLVTLAAVLGQIERWKTALHTNDGTTPPVQKQKIKSDAVQKGVPEVLVRFKPGFGLDKVRALAAANHDKVYDEIESVDGLAVIDDLDDADPATVAAQYAALPGVEYAEPNFRINLDDPIQKEVPRDLVLRNNPLLPNDPQFSEQWALNNTGQDGGTSGADISAMKAWEKTQGSEDVVVAVLDSGVDFNHVDLRGNMWTRPADVPAYKDDELGEFNDLQGFNGTDSIADPMDDNGHGTHCAGIIGAEGDNGEGVVGVNWHVRIMPLKFLGRGGFGTTEDAIEAINYAIDRKKHGVNIRVISASWGSNSYSKALEDTIRAAGDAGILFVAAAGNDGSSNDRRPHYPSNYDLPNVISVAALDRNDQLASFSNFGVKTVHVAAPGKDILSTWLGDNYREASGTSMATPYVSGIAALVIAHEPSITMPKLRERLLKATDEVPQLNGKVASGGRIDAAKALQY
ncbi:MAG: S8 family serine peptidase [Acidobacteria bacterium]|nr:S8 family serine peptidase [Acidobacteriota bacterium]